MCSTQIYLAMSLNEIKCHVNTSLGLVGGCPHLFQHFINIIIISSVSILLGDINCTCD